MPRSNGFETPFDPHQVATWVAFVLLMGSFFGLYTPVYTDGLGITLSCVYGIAACVTFASGTMCMRTDPCDSGVLDKCAGITTPEAVDVASSKNYCYLCEAHVEKRSKHCRRCNKCVDTFDHHCPWLNTCVGSKNYKAFLLLLVSVFTLTSLQMGTSLQASLEQLQHEGRVRLRDAYNGSLNPIAYVVLHGVTVLLCLAAWLLIMQLLTFHVGLIYRGMTTYEFIVAQRKRQAAEADAQHRAKKTSCLRKNFPCLFMCSLCEPLEPKTAASANKSISSTQLSMSGSRSSQSASARPGNASLSNRGQPIQREPSSHTSGEAPNSGEARSRVEPPQGSPKESPKNSFT